MKKIVLKISFLFLLTSCKIDFNLFYVDNSKIGVKNSRIRGTIFNNNYQFPFSNNSVNRWTPEKKDIELAENLLNQYIKKINENQPNQIGNCPIIHKNLNNYFRQYIGILNDKGQKVIHINFYWDKYSWKERFKGNFDKRLSFDSDYTVILDGCSYYWQINVNLDEKTLNEFKVNGLG
jgi:hypothetical protein